MKRRSVLTLMVAAATGAGVWGSQVVGQNAPTAQSAAPPARAKHVFIVSFDGGKPSVMHASKMPVTMAMANQGAVTWEAQTIFPSLTLPSHTSMLTGVGPDKHKVLWNDDRANAEHVKVPTSFQAAKARGLKTAMFAGKSKFHHLNIPASLDKVFIPAYETPKMVAEAARYIVAEKPNLCFIHFADSDVAGHKYGWGSPEQVKAFEDEDEALKKLQDAVTEAGIAADSVFILTSDHGGQGHSHGSNSPEDMTIPWIAYGKSVKPGTKITAPVVTYDSAATALWLLGVPPLRLPSRPTASCARR